MKGNPLQMIRSYWKQSFTHDLLASLVVFLVALPLCMGIALASGAPPLLGLISGVIGGIVIGTFAGAPLQVSGPAAGLAVMVFEFVNRFGLAALGILGLIVGITQMLAAVFRLGHYFRATSPALIKGMLSGIGLLILASQFHIMLDASPYSSGLTNLLALPEAALNFVSRLFDPFQESNFPYAGILGLLTLFILVLWTKAPFAWAKKIPAPLVAVVTTATLAQVADFPVKFVSLPENFWGTLKIAQFWSSHGEQGLSLSPALLLSSLAIAFVASIETLLSVSALDQLKGGKGSRYNQEMFAQGMGNFFAGLCGALPITGVIVRSSVNVSAGGKTRMSAIFHGLWLLLFLVFFPQLLQMIPTSSLAAILILTGLKLLNLKVIKTLRSYGWGEVGVYLATFSIVVGVDLLTGVIVGFGLSLLLYLFRTMKLEIAKETKENQFILSLKGSGCFLNIPRLAPQLDSLQIHQQQIILQLEELSYVDHAFQELIDNWVQKQKQNDKEVQLFQKVPSPG